VAGGKKRTIVNRHLEKEKKGLGSSQPYGDRAKRREVYQMPRFTGEEKEKKRIYNPISKRIGPFKTRPEKKKHCTPQQDRKKKPLFGGRGHSLIEPLKEEEDKKCPGEDPKQGEGRRGGLQPLLGEKKKENGTSSPILK